MRVLFTNCFEWQTEGWSTLPFFFFKKKRFCQLTRPRWFCVQTIWCVRLRSFNTTESNEATSASLVAAMVSKGGVSSENVLCVKTKLFIFPSSIKTKHDGWALFIKPSYVMCIMINETQLQYYFDRSEGDLTINQKCITLSLNFHIIITVHLISIHHI